MSRDCNHEELEALSAGTLDEATSKSVAEHVAECAACAEELTWLRAEEALMARRKEKQPPLPDAMWAAIHARIATPRIVTDAPQASGDAPSSPRPSVPLEPPRPSLVRERRVSLGSIAYGSLLVAAAAALLFVAWPHQTPITAPIASMKLPSHTVQPQPERKKLTPDQALSNAEHEYQEALTVLEAQYHEKRCQLPPTVAKRYDSVLEKTRERVSDARIAAGNDVEGRMLVLDGYEAYLRSLQTIVSDMH